MVLLLEVSKCIMEMNARDVDSSRAFETHRNIYIAEVVCRFPLNILR